MQRQRELLDVVTRLAIAIAASMRMKVDLPAPFGPSSPRIPGLISRERFFNNTCCYDIFTAKRLFFVSCPVGQVVAEVAPPKNRISGVSGKRK